MDVNSPEAALWSENMRLKSENEYLRSPAVVAWRVHDPENGWIIFEKEEAARQCAKACDGELQELFTRAAA